MLEVIRVIEGVEEIRDELEDVYQGNNSWSFFSPTFVISAYKEFLEKDDRNQLCFIINKSKKKVEAYIPLYIDKDKVLRFIFDRHTDYCGIVGQKPEFSFFKDFANLIFNDREIKRVDFDNLLPDDLLLNYLKHFLGNSTVILSYNNHSYLTSTGESEFLSNLKSKGRSELKRVQKKNSDYLFCMYSGKTPFPEKELIELRNRMIKSKSRSNAFFNSPFIHLARDLYNADELEIFTKKNQDKLISASLVLRNNFSSRRMVWIDLFDDVQYINLSAYIDYINYLIQFSPITFSFGRGSYDYKTKNFAPEIQNLYNLRFSKSRFDLFFSQYYGIKQFVKHVIRK